MNLPLPRSLIAKTLGDDSGEASGFAWAFEVPYESISRLEEFRFELKGTPPVPLAPKLLPFEWKPGNEPRFRWRSGSGKWVLFQAGDALGYEARIYLGNEEISALTVSGLGDEPLRLQNQVVAFPNIKVLWADQPYEIRDSFGNVLSVSQRILPE